MHIAAFYLLRVAYEQLETPDSSVVLRPESDNCSSFALAVDFTHLFGITLGLIVLPLALLGPLEDC